MPQPNRFAVRDALAAARRKPSYTALFFVAASLAWLTGGIACLWLRIGDAGYGPILAPAGVVLIGCALLQLRITLAAWRGERFHAGSTGLEQFWFWRSLFTGALLAYLVALAIGPVSNIGCAWLAAVCGWQTILMLPLAAAPNALDEWRQWTRGHAARRLAWLVYASALILGVTELGLRAQRMVADGVGLPGSLAELDEASFQTTEARSDEPLSARVARLNRARFRIAMLGNPPICDCHSDGCPARIEQTVPGVEIVPLANWVSWPGARSDELSAQVRRCEPDLVLAVLSVCEDLARKAATRGYFDWRQFEVANLLLGESPIDGSSSDRPPTDNFESFLGGLGPQLAACRTPIDDEMQARWNRIFASLNHLMVGCRDARVPVAVVIVPAEFQMNPALCGTLLRRHGLPAERFDAELPQRRLAGFAEHRNLSLIDLLPHLRLCRQSVYRRNTTRLSEEGNAAAASAIGGWLQSRYGGQLAAQLSQKP